MINFDEKKRTAYQVISTMIVSNAKKVENSSNREARKLLWLPKLYKNNAAQYKSPVQAVGIFFLWYCDKLTYFAHFLHNHQYPKCIKVYIFEVLGWRRVVILTGWIKATTKAMIPACPSSTITSFVFFFFRAMVF